MNLRRFLGHCRVTSLWRVFIAVVLIIFIIEVLLLHCVIIYVYLSVKQELAPFSTTQGNYMDKLMGHPRLKELLFFGKDGAFVKALQETLERVYITRYTYRREGAPGEPEILEPEVSFLGLDVSHSGEASFLQRRLASRASFPYPRLLVDVGASDGLLSSNSFNFLQWGWSAILVEPQASETDRIRRNVARYVDPYNDGNQTLTIVEAVICKRDGRVKFAISDRSLGMESHLVGLHSNVNYNKSQVIEVPCYTVKTLASRYNIPKAFGILSVDAEGVGDEVLHQWIDEGFRPAYILYESMHNKEPLSTTSVFLEQHGYRYLTKRGWNNIYEYRDTPRKIRKTHG